MARRGTRVNLVDGRFVLMAGEPMLDTVDGVLVIQYEDGTSRTFNWKHVVDYYYFSEEEFEELLREVDVS